MSTTRISIERTRSRDISGYSNHSRVEEEREEDQEEEEEEEEEDEEASEGHDEVLSNASHDGHGSEAASGEESSWENLGGEELEILDSASAITRSNQESLEEAPPQPPPSSRGSSRRRVAAPEPAKRRPSNRDIHVQREHRPPRERYIRRELPPRRGPPSVTTDSVDYQDDYEGPDPRFHPQHRHPQYAYVPHQQPPPAHGYPPSSVGSHPHFGNYQQGHMPGAPPTSQLVPFQQHHDPFAYYQQSAMSSPTYAPPNPFSPAPSSSMQSGYFGGFDPRSQVPPQMHPMGMMPYPYMPFQPSQQPSGGQGTSTGRTSPSDADEKYSKLEALLMAQEDQRVAREREREAMFEAEKKKAEARAAAEAAEKQNEEAISQAAKKAKEAAEEEAQKKAREAEDKHEKALKNANEKAEAAKKAQKAAEEETGKYKPSDDDKKAPIKFKDAVGRKFSFPYRLCKTWKGMEDLIRQAFLNVDEIGELVQEGHYDLVGPDGEIILPRVWDSVIQPDWTITMHMWPIAEEKKEDDPKAPAPPPPPSHVKPSGGSKKDRSRGILGSRRKRPTSMPPPPDAPEAPAPPSSDGGPIIEVVPQDKERKKNNRRSQSVTPFLAWTSGGMVRRR